MTPPDHEEDFFEEVEEEEEVTKEANWMRRSKWLTHGLIISATINMALIATFVYFGLKERERSIEYALTPVEDENTQPLIEVRSHKAVLSELAVMNSDALFTKLSSDELIEDGFTERDLALAYLVAFYDFDLERALSSIPKQKRQLPFSSPYLPAKNYITVYQGLTDGEFSRITYFAKTEQWPYNSRGLFKRLQSVGIDADKSLADAFYLTSEFILLEALFSRADIPVSRLELLELALEGRWYDLSVFTDDQKKMQDLSLSKRIRFLLDYVNAGSKKQLIYY